MYKVMKGVKKEQKLKDIKTGEVFNIENTPTYPKLKLDEGYIDIRDEIVNLNNDLPFRCYIMTKEDQKEQYTKWGMSDNEYLELINQLIKQNEKLEK